MLLANDGVIAVFKTNKTMRKKLIIGLLCLFGTLAFGQNKNADYLLFVGTYTQKTSEGIYVYRFDARTGDFAPLSIAKSIPSPSFLALSPNQRFLYAVEGGGELVRAFAIDKASGELTFLNSQSSGGKNPAHLTVDKTGKWLIVGNYGGGSLSVLPIKADGSVGQATQTIQHQGSSINPSRQAQPHVHSINIAPNNKDVFVPDLGTDKIMAYALDTQTGQLLAQSTPFVSSAPGSGPRHFTYHPNGKFAYVIEEMGGTVTGFNYKNGTLKAFQTIATLPEDYNGQKSCADLHISPDGQFLYGSNRVHQSLVIYRINQKTGQLTFVAHQAVNGKTPRNFAIDPTGNFVLVANQDTDNVVVFRRNKKTGALTPTGKEIGVSMPVCLVFMLRK